MEYQELEAILTDPVRFREQLKTATSVESLADETMNRALWSDLALASLTTDELSHLATNRVGLIWLRDGIALDLPTGWRSIVDGAAKGRTSQVDAPQLAKSAPAHEDPTLAAALGRQPVPQSQRNRRRYYRKSFEPLVTEVLDEQTRQRVVTEEYMQRLRVGICLNVWLHNDKYRWVLTLEQPKSWPEPRGAKARLVHANHTLLTEELVQLAEAPAFVDEHVDRTPYFFEIPWPEPEPILKADSSHSHLWVECLGRVPWQFKGEIHRSSITTEFLENWFAYHRAAALQRVFMITSDEMSADEALTDAVDSIVDPMRLISIRPKSFLVMSCEVRSTGVDGLFEREKNQLVC